MQAIALIQSIIILVAAHYGFGTSIVLLQPDVVVRIQNVRLYPSTELILWGKKLIYGCLKMLVASDVLYIISQYFAKISVMSILLQLTPQRKHNLATCVAGGVCTIWLVVSVLLITVNCEANKPREPAAELCMSLVCEILYFQAWY